MTESNAIQVDEYLYFQHQTTGFPKRLRRQVRKAQCGKVFQQHTYNTVQDIPHAVFQQLGRKKGTNKYIGVLCDTNDIIRNVASILHIPRPPDSDAWDIVCLDSVISSYDFTCPQNNVYYCRAIVKSSHHFVINPASMNTVLAAFKDAVDMATALNTLRTFTITQHYLSEHMAYHIRRPHDLFVNSCSKEQKQKAAEEYTTACQAALVEHAVPQALVQVDTQAHAFDTALAGLPDTEKYRMYPTVSFVCIISSTDKAFHLIHSFLRISMYPREKLQLVIVDDMDAEKRLKSVLPKEDSRIKIINITTKQESSTVKLPLGYKLNTGVKYADNDIIFHCFDTCHYMFARFPQILKAFVTEQCEVLCAYESAHRTGEVSSVKKGPCIEMMVYNKNFWRAQLFEETFDTGPMVLYTWLSHRQPCVQYAPFVFFGFSVSDCVPLQASILPFALDTLVGKHVYESFQMAFGGSTT